MARYPKFIVFLQQKGNGVAQELRKNFNRVTSERGFCGKLPEEEMRGKRSKVSGKQHA